MLQLSSECLKVSIHGADFRATSLTALYPLMPPFTGSAATGPASLLQVVEGRVISVLNGQRWEHSPKAN
jgi:hypothetical protein